MNPEDSYRDEPAQIHFLLLWVTIIITAGFTGQICSIKSQIFLMQRVRKYLVMEHRRSDFAFYFTSLQNFRTFTIYIFHIIKAIYF